MTSDLRDLTAQLELSLVETVGSGGLSSVRLPLATEPEAAAVLMLGSAAGRPSQPGSSR